MIQDFPRLMKYSLQTFLFGLFLYVSIFALIISVQCNQNLKNFRQNDKLRTRFITF